MKKISFAALVAVAFVSGVALTRLHAYYFPPQDLSVERCELNGNRGDIIPPWWFRCVDVEGSVAFREPVTIPSHEVQDAMDKSRAEYLAELATEAPETLRPPERAAFVSDDAYRAALVKYALRGEWATE